MCFCSWALSAIAHLESEELEEETIESLAIETVSKVSRKAHWPFLVRRNGRTAPRPFSGRAIRGTTTLHPGNFSAPNSGPGRRSFSSLPICVSRRSLRNTYLHLFALCTFWILNCWCKSQLLALASVEMNLQKQNFSLLILISLSFCCVMHQVHLPALPTLLMWSVCSIHICIRGAKLG